MNSFFSIIIHLKPHSILYFIVFKRDMILKDYICFLQSYLFRSGSYLRRYEFFELQNSISWTALDTLPLAEAIIYHYFNQNRRIRIVNQLALTHEVQDLNLLCYRKVGRS